MKVQVADDGMLLFWCPGCKCSHGVRTVDTPGDGPVWEFNNNMESPTIRPSIRVRWQRFPTDEETIRILSGEVIGLDTNTCHSYVIDGKIQFLDDCTHSLAGQTVELSDMEEPSETTN